MAQRLESTDAKNKLEDLSGIELHPGDNPYKALIEACHNDSVSIITSRSCSHPHPQAPSAAQSRYSGASDHTVSAKQDSYNALEITVFTEKLMQ